jgi:hypothetical protein
MSLQKLNSLIPMEDADGNRCFVNQWDVPGRQQDGWRVVGKLEQHTSTTKAPVEALGGDGKPDAKKKPAAGDGKPDADGKPAAK